MGRAGDLAQQPAALWARTWRIYELSPSPSGVCRPHNHSCIRDDGRRHCRVAGGRYGRGLVLLARYFASAFDSELLSTGQDEVVWRN